MKKLSFLRREQAPAAQKVKTASMTPEVNQLPTSKSKIRNRKWFKPLASILIVLIFTTAWSIGTSLTAPGNDPVSARLAEWARNHNLGAVVTVLENLQYKINKPKIGGTVKIEINKNNNVIGIQDTLTSLNPVALPGEGVFQPAIKMGKNSIIQFAQLRPDTIHTSYLASVIWISGAHTTFQLRPGFSDPGKLSRFPTGDIISRQDRNLIATFNSGFKLDSAKGGFYLAGVMAKPLIKGSATLVTFKDGHSAIGMWGRDFQMDSSIESARQNLKLLIDNGKVSSDIKTAVQSNWGATLGFKDFVWRSGIGETASGDFVYVCGNALSAESLANLLLDAGAIRAMQLDINPQWISFMWYKKSGANKIPIKAALFDRPADRYFSPSSRDFFAVYAK